MKTGRSSTACAALKPDTVRTIRLRDVLTPLAKRVPLPEEELGFKDGRLHSFRHYFCSTCANGGEPETVVRKWLGHRAQSLRQVASNSDPARGCVDGCVERCTVGYRQVCWRVTSR